MRVLVVNADSSSLKLRLLGGRDEVINSADLPAGDSRSDDSGLAARRFGWIRPAGPSYPPGERSPGAPNPRRHDDLLNDLGAGHAEIIPRDPFVVGLIFTHKNRSNGRRHPFADSFIPFMTIWLRVWLAVRPPWVSSGTRRALAPHSG